MALTKLGNYRHGMAYSPEWKVWSKMKDRCSNPNNNRYKQYGGRGIGYCYRWVKFKNFYSDLGPRPSPQHTLERKNVNIGYTPDNCEWIQKSRQALNRTDTRHLTINGVKMALMDWAKRNGLKSSTVHMRINKYGWEPGLAVTTPARKHKPYGTSKTSE